MPSQAAAQPRHEEQEATDKIKQAQTGQTHEKHQNQSSTSQARQPQSKKDQHYENTPIQKY